MEIQSESLNNNLKSKLKYNFKRQSLNCTMYETVEKNIFICDWDFFFLQITYGMGPYFGP